MTEAASQSIMSGQGAQDQVLLPARVAFNICLRGIRTRLGRSFVTLSGVALGIAFLMSVVSGFHIKFAMRADAAIARDIERRLVVCQGEVGLLKGKQITVLIGEPDARDFGFIAELVSAEAEVRVAGLDPPPEGTRATVLPADAASSGNLFLLGRYEPLLTPPVLAAMAGRKVLTFEPPTADVQAQLTAAGAQLRRLGIDLRPEDIARADRRAKEARYRMYWIVAVSLLITVGGITNAMLMSVTERFREIATMKCLGAMSTFIVKLFLIESSLIGLVGSLFGCILGVSFPLLAYSYTFSFAKVFSATEFGTLGLYGLSNLAIGMVLAVVAGIYPARVAAKMIPAAALRSQV